MTFKRSPDVQRSGSDILDPAQTETVSGAWDFTGGLSVNSQPLSGCPLRVVALGDSITYANENVSSYPYIGLSWARLACLKSQGAFSFVRNAGVSGNTTAQMLARFDTDVAPYPHDVLALLGGTNDAWAFQVPLATFAANIKAIADKEKARGGITLIGTVPPQGMLAVGTPAAPTLTARSTGGTLGAATYSYRIAAVNSAGTSLASSAATVVVGSGTTNSIVIAPPYVPGATSYKIYGRTGGSELLIATITGGAWMEPANARYIDTGSVTPSGAVPGSDTTAVAYDATTQNLIASYNDWLRAWAPTRRDVILFKSHSALADMATNVYAQGYSFDGIHPSPSGTSALATAAYTSLAGLATPRADRLIKTQVDATNLFGNALLQTSIASSFTISNGDPTNPGVARSAVTRSGFAGNCMLFTVPFIDTSSPQSYSSTVSTGFSPGDQLLWGFRLETANQQAGGMLFRFTLETNPGAAVFAEMRIGGIDLGPTPVEQIVTVPTGATGIRMHLACFWGTGDIYLGEFTIKNLTTGQILTNV
jgi:lysophospholipase L1-like esterase